MKKVHFIAVLFFAFSAACASSEKMAMQSSVRNEGSNANVAPAAPTPLNQPANPNAAPIVIERRIIRNADLQLETDQPQEAQNKIAQIAEGKGGFVVETTQSSSDVKATTRDTITMTARVPAAKFQESLGEIRQTASRVVSETVKGQDVTEEFVDIEARLKAKKALEEQFLEIMKRSNSVADALNVQRELANVRGEIEQVEGRKRFLENQSSLSTIKVVIKTPAAFSGSSQGFFYRLKSSVGSGIDAASGVLFFLITALIALLPFFIIVILPLYFLLKYLWRRAQRKMTATEIAREEISEK